MKTKKEKVNLEEFGFPNYGDFYHDVNIHLINGETLTTLENEDVSEEMSILNEFRHGQNPFLNIVYGIDGLASIPKDKILYITLGNIHKI